jgi:hypothetical protein
MDSFSWLHLTDLHRGMTAQSCLWPNVEQQFFADLDSLHSTCGPWDIILWSGDLVQKGASGEYSKFSDTMSRLYKNLKKLGSNPVLVTIPGNHDLVRPNPSNPQVKELGKWNEETEISQEFWRGDKSNLQSVIKKAFRNYTTWERNHPFPRPTEATKGRIPGDTAVTVDVRGWKIGIIGLNSTFLQLTEGDYEGKLAIATEQLTAVCGEHFTDWFDRHHCCFLMTHHPPAWLNASSIETLMSEIAMPGRFVAQVCGHLHQSLVISKSVGGAASQVTLGTTRIA